MIVVMIEIKLVIFVIIFFGKLSLIESKGLLYFKSLLFYK